MSETLKRYAAIRRSAPALLDLTVPRRFYDDHVSRDCAQGQVARLGQRTVSVRMTPEEVVDLLSDAEYYADGTEWSDDPYMRGLSRSAAATVRAIARALATAGVPV